ncbi:MAG TPA: 16S rRNA (cytidine(1402)-2'-O)-methyltransferase [Solirubrobacterales bacterium]|nr:16S rRNA (cytidine(1402)-2'-O)-methyltransferase [Solirubrobacterales bacterium]
MPGRLVVCPTPIGNMDDITERVRVALSEADIVACEDTRRTGLLFECLGLRRPRLVSNHEGNETERARQLVSAIQRGAKVALISDSGMPAISDPGYRLINACIDRSIDVEVLPGPSAVITALVVSGLPTDRWRFEGFLPRRAGELERVLGGGQTVVAFESPRRLPESLAALSALAPDRPAAVCRELTKLHEEVVRGTLAELSRRFREGQKGEIVVVIGPAAKASSSPDIAFAVDALRRLVQSGARPRAAASVVAALTGTRANELYTALTGREPRE